MSEKSDRLEAELDALDDSQPNTFQRRRELTAELQRVWRSERRTRKPKSAREWFKHMHSVVANAPEPSLGESAQGVIRKLLN